MKGIVHLQNGEPMPIGCRRFEGLLGESEMDSCQQLLSFIGTCLLYTSDAADE